MISIKKFLFPASYYSGTTSVYWAIVVNLLLAIGVYYSKVQIDGALDFHVNDHQSWYKAIVEVIIDWGSISVIFYTIASLLGSPIRIIDSIGVFGMSRAIFILPIILTKWVDNYMPIVRDGSSTILKNGNLVHVVLFSIFLIVTIICMIYFIYNLFHIYKVNSNFKKTKLTLTFILGLILAEILSKILLTYILA